MTVERKRYGKPRWWRLLRSPHFFLSCLVRWRRRHRDSWRDCVRIAWMITSVNCAKDEEWEVEGLAPNGDIQQRWQDGVPVVNERPIKVVGDLKAELAAGRSQDKIGVTVDGHGCELMGVDHVLDEDPSFTAVYLRVKSSKQWRDARKDHGG